MRRASRFALLMLIGLGFGTAASAAPVLQYRIFQDDALQVGFIGSSATGSLFASGPASNFALLSVVAANARALAAPALLVQTTNISSFNSFIGGPHTIRLEVSQTGLDSQSAGGLLASTLTANIPVNSSLVGGVTVTNYADAADVAFSRATLLASASFSGQGMSATPVITQAVTLPNPTYSQTVIISATFLGGGAVVNASSQIVAVPEPATLGLFGLGLIGLAALRRRKEA